MNWYKAKTILIVFFIITNAFLLYNIISTGKSDNYINDEIILYTTDILKKNGIEINTNIPRKNKQLKQFNADNIVSDHEKFAKNILGKNLVHTDENTYQSDVGKLSFEGDKFYLKFNDFPTAEKNKATAVTKALDSLKIDISDYVLKESDDLVVLQKQNDGIDVFNCDLSIRFSENGISEISGVWFEKTSDISSSSELKPITTVLIDILSSPDRPIGNANITDISLGYMTYDFENYHKSIVPIPVWKITFSDNRFMYMDARAN